MYTPTSPGNDFTRLSTWITRSWVEPDARPAGTATSALVSAIARATPSPRITCL